MLSRSQSYHGSTLGALAVSGNVRRREIYVPMVREFTHVGIPYCYRCVYNCLNGCTNCAEKYAGELEKAVELSEGEAAAFILEPVSGATLGAAVPSAHYMQRIAEICERRGVLPAFLRPAKTVRICRAAFGALAKRGGCALYL
jgi:adenosylmethionine-8-amino-7-oxononanoate aminotransferase